MDRILNVALFMCNTARIPPCRNRLVPSRMGDTERLLRIDDIVIVFHSNAIRCLVLLPLTPNGYFRYALREYLREAEVYRIAFEKEKELTDRPLNLAEVGKPKSNWELQGILRVAAFVLGFLVGE